MKTLIFRSYPIPNKKKQTKSTTIKPPTTTNKTNKQTKTKQTRTNKQMKQQQQKKQKQNQAISCGTRT